METVTEIWEDGDEIYVRYENGDVGQVNYGWWNGCQSCGESQDEINEILNEQGAVEAVRFYFKNLPYGLCPDCLKGEMPEKFDQWLKENPGKDPDEVYEQQVYEQEGKYPWENETIS